MLPKVRALAVPLSRILIIAFCVFPQDPDEVAITRFAACAVITSESYWLQSGVTVAAEVTVCILGIVSPNVDVATHCVLVPFDISIVPDVPVALIESLNPPHSLKFVVVAFVPEALVKLKTEAKKFVEVALVNKALGELKKFTVLEATVVVAKVFVALKVFAVNNPAKVVEAYALVIPLDIVAHKVLVPVEVRTCPAVPVAFMESRCHPDRLRLVVVELTNEEDRPERVLNHPLVKVSPVPEIAVVDAVVR